MANTIPEQEVAWAAHKAECLRRYRECKHWYGTRDRSRINAWLNTLTPAEQQNCRRVLNQIREAEHDR